MEKTTNPPQKSESGLFKIALISLVLVICVSMVSIAVFLILKPLKIEMEQAEEVKEDEKEVTVSGEGKVSVTPDIAEINITVFTIAETTEASQDENTKKMKKVIEELKGLKINERDIQTSSYDIQPEYEWEDNKRILKGYRTAESILVKIRNIDEAGKILTKAAAAGANDISGIRFYVDDMEKYRKEAMNLAIKNARERAEVLVKSAGGELGEVMNITKSDISTPSPVLYEDVKALGEAAEEAAVPEIQKGQEEIIINVEVVFGIK